MAVALPWTTRRTISAVNVDMIGGGANSAEEVRGTAEVAGLSLEDRAAIKVAWTAATQETRARAAAAMHEWGYGGDDTATLFTAFAAKAIEDEVNALIGILISTVAPDGFDPDAAEPAAQRE